VSAAAGPILLGFDGSEESKAALAETVRLAGETGSRVVVCFAYYISPLGGGDMRDLKEQLEKVAEHETARAVADLEAAGIEATARHVSGKPAEAILATADEVGARLIVAGATERSPLAGAILGSVVLHLVQRSPVPVLVVPAKAAAPE
jgi:nucleotide-binding universal stress UspA family protein